MKTFHRNDPLYVNYFKFMEWFRGTVELKDDFASVTSTKKEFTFGVPHTSEGTAHLLVSTKNHTLLVPANSKTALPQQWKERGGLTFMTLDDGKTSESGENTEPVEVLSGNSEKIIKGFSQAQCAGFLETPEVYTEWAQWLTQCNRNNSKNKNVTFYAVKVSSIFVSGAIAVRSPDCVGIYGVATHPQYRKRGLGTLLLRKIMEDSDPGHGVGLQVETGSYAHQYYLKLGFQNLYEFRRMKNEN